MFEDDNYLVFRSPCRYEYDSKLCLAMKVEVNTSPDAVFHVVVERCRCVLFTFAGQVLVCPQSDHFLLICDQTFASSDRFRSTAARISVVEAWSSPVTSQVLAECITYTLTARISPEWNKVGGWLLQGKKFLHHAQPVNAVKVKVNVANERLEVCAKATKVAFPLIRPQELGVDEEVLDWFVNGDENCVLTEREFGHQYLHVLPRLTRAKLISITKKIPPTSTTRIKNWNSMKSYWKNMYGYRLGVDEDDVPTVYYNVNFWNGLSLTYPEWTVRLAEPRIIPRTDPKPILEAFIKDLVLCNKVVFGMKFSLDQVPLVPVVTAVAPQYGQQEVAVCARQGWPAAKSVPFRPVQTSTALHPPVWRSDTTAKSGVRGESSLTDLTEEEWKKGSNAKNPQAAIGPRKVFGNLPAKAEKESIAGIKDHQTGAEVREQLMKSFSRLPVYPKAFGQVESRVKSEVKTRDSGYLTPAPSKKVKPSFMMNLNTSRAKKVQAPKSRFVNTPGRVTARLGEYGDPLSFTEDPKFKAAVARAKAHLTKSQKPSKAAPKKENKKKEVKPMDEDIMAF